MDNIKKLRDSVDTMKLGKRVAYTHVTEILQANFRYPNGMWTSARAKAVYDEVCRQIKNLEE